VSRLLSCHLKPLWFECVGYNSFVAEQVHAKTDVKKNL
jgi:hypothetical protein